MAIEFDCPYCTSTIRVPDEAAGKAGRCPRCGTRLLVPVPKIAAALGAGGDEPILEDVAPAEGVVAMGLPSPSPPPQPGELPTRPLTPPPRPVRKPQDPWLLAGGVIGALVAVIGGAAVLVTVANGMQLWERFLPERLAGEATAAELESLDLKPRFVSRELVDQPRRVVDEALEQLEQSPLPLLSQMISLHVAGSKKGLSVSLNNGPQAAWYRVNVRSNGRLMRSMNRVGERLDQRRHADLKAAATGLIKTYSEIRADRGELTDITAYRDSFGLTSLVQGLGYHLSAVVGHTAYPCVYEGDDGALYFLLPRHVRSFTLKARSVGDGPPFLPGEIVVKVTSEASRDAGTPPQKSSGDAGAGQQTAPEEETSSDVESREGL